MFRYLAILWLGRLVAWLPLRLAYPFAGMLGNISYYLNRPARRVAHLHMRRVLGPAAPAWRVRRAARGCLRAAAYYYADLMRTPGIDPVRFNRDNIHDSGYEHIEQAIAGGRGAILVSFHYGNPELVSQCLVARGLTYMALVEPLQPPALAKLFHGYRSSLGHQYAEADLDGIKQVIRHLRRGGVLAVLIDRDIQHNGIEAPLFEAPARLPTGAVDLALRTGAPVLPVITRRLRLNEFEATIEPPVEMVRTGDLHRDRRVNTALLARRFEPYLRRDPSQWFVLEEPVWPCVPRPARQTGQPRRPLSAG